MDDTICSRDAISWFPDEVLGKILSLLPTKQAASTSVLSKKWRYVFRLVDNLDFDDSASGEDKLERDLLSERDKYFLATTGYVPEEYKIARYMFPESFKNFVNRTLALQGDSPINKFSLKCHVGAENDCQKACVSRWISNVVERGVLELDLRITDLGLQFMPPQLLASKTLVKLTIGTQLNLEKLPSSDVLLPSLKSLFIDTVFFDYDDLCCVLLAGCPMLEELSVHHHAYEGTPQDISSLTVKRLSIDYNCDHTSGRCYLSLNLPNLVYLEYSDHTVAEYPQVNLESLVEAKLDLYPLGVDWWKPDVGNLFLGIRNVEILHLSPFSVDVISLCVKHHGLVLPVFNNLVNLSFGSNNKKGWKSLAYLLKQSPNLETLIIQDLNSYTCIDVSMPLNKVKVLRILSYRQTAQALKQLKCFIGESKCLEVDVVEEDNVLQTKRGLKMLLGVSLPSKCHFKVT